MPNSKEKYGHGARPLKQPASVKLIGRSHMVPQHVGHQHESLCAVNVNCFFFQVTGVNQLLKVPVILFVGPKNKDNPASIL